MQVARLFVIHGLTGADGSLSEFVAGGNTDHQRDQFLNTNPRPRCAVDCRDESIGVLFGHCHANQPKIGIRFAGRIEDSLIDGTRFGSFALIQQRLAKEHPDRSRIRSVFAQLIQAIRQCVRSICGAIKVEQNLERFFAATTAVKVQIQIFLAVFQLILQKVRAGQKQVVFAGLILFHATQSFKCLNGFLMASDFHHDAADSFVTCRTILYHRLMFAVGQFKIFGPFESIKQHFVAVGSLLQIASCQKDGGANLMDLHKLR